MPKQKPVVLVLGDTLVDENWLMSRHSSYHSYNVGQQHYISTLEDADCCITALSGAAGVLRVLAAREFQDEKTGSKPSLAEKYDFALASLWHPEDERWLQCMLCNEKKITVHMVPSRLRDHLEDCELLEGGAASVKCAKPLLCNMARDRKVSTNRLVRLYEGYLSDQPTLRYRFDWRLEPAPPTIKWVERLSAQGREVKAIVVVDHGYGAVTEDVVNALRQKFGKAKWYVRCKVDAPQWFRKLAEKRNFRFRLLFTDEQIERHRLGPRKWRYSQGVVGRGALRVLEYLLGFPKHGDEKPDGTPRKPGAEIGAFYLDDDTAFTALKTADSDDATIVNLSERPGEKQLIQVGRSMVFFSSLVFWDLTMDGKLTKDNLLDASAWARDNAYDWSKDCTEAWLKKAPDRLSGQFDKPFVRDPKHYRAHGSHPSGLKYRKSWADWDAASCKRGIVSVENGTDQPPGERIERIELWRASGLLKNYICPGGEKRRRINDLVKRLQAYRREKEPRHPFNCLLVGLPGWGKSFLAKCIAEQFDFERLQFSIAEMASNVDLINALKTIVSVQNRTDRRVLIFIDEIDAQIETHPAMGLLLNPMWDGSFAADGNTYRIHPCVWVFAGTKSEKGLQREPKGRDFVSRINGPIIALDLLNDQDRDKIERTENPHRRIVAIRKALQREENIELRTELVYHGINHLNRLFGPISVVDRSILEAFYNSVPTNGVRSIEILASRFRNISRGRVAFENLPDFEAHPELKRHIQKLRWPTKNRNKPVAIVVRPQDGD